MSRDQARMLLIGHLGLGGDREPGGGDGARSPLSDLRCIQLDPLDRIGTNADLVAPARFEGRRLQGRLVVERLWIEDAAELDDAAWREALARHEIAL